MSSEFDEFCDFAQKQLPNFVWHKNDEMQSLSGHSHYPVRLYVGLVGYQLDDPLDPSVSIGPWWVVEVTGGDLISRMDIGREQHFRDPKVALQSAVILLQHASSEFARLASGVQQEVIILPKTPDRDGIWHKYNARVWRATKGPYVAEVLCPPQKTPNCEWSVYYGPLTGGEVHSETDVEVAKDKAMQALLKRHTLTYSVTWPPPTQAAT
jgi:hypothetical protein